MANRKSFRAWLSSKLATHLVALTCGVIIGMQLGQGKTNFAVAQKKEEKSHHVKSPTLQGIVEPGIYPLMRDFQCGHINMQTPRVLQKRAKDSNDREDVGRGRIVIDVGLGNDAKETFEAVGNGFVVFAFEIMTGSFSKYRSIIANTSLSDVVHFVEFEGGPDGRATPKELPTPPAGKGFAYLFNAGLSDASGSIESRAGSNPLASIGKVNGTESLQTWKPGMVPIMTLEQALPEWVDKIFLAKVDTQGNELKVLKGMDQYLRANKVQYVNYEFSPWLMRHSNLGDPMVLLELVPSMGGVCFDMTGEHNKITRPSKDMVKYFEVLDSGTNGNKFSAEAGPQMYQQEMKRINCCGPWDDILCWFPSATD